GAAGALGPLVEGRAAGAGHGVARGEHRVSRRPEPDGDPRGVLPVTLAAELTPISHTITGGLLTGLASRGWGVSVTPITLREPAGFRAEVLVTACKGGARYEFHADATHADAEVALEDAVGAALSLAWAELGRPPVPA